jgi:hypothetical protein
MDQIYFRFVKKQSIESYLFNKNTLIASLFLFDEESLRVFTDGIRFFAYWM